MINNELTQHPMTTVEPITTEQQQQVVQRVAELLRQCQLHFNKTFRSIEIRFDLRGRTSGMYVVKSRQQYIRFNPFIFSKYFEDSLASTVTHEVAHYVADVLFGFKNIRPHGKEWQAIMYKLGAEPKVTGDYDLSGIPVKRQHRFTYACDCMTHQLTTTRHNRITQEKARYFCRKCHGTLKHQSAMTDNHAQAL
jgi:SprT protein